MKQEIKERIELINKGIVPAGYKKTPVGICHVEWEDFYLKDLYDFYGGLGIPREKLGNKGIPYLHYGDMHISEKMYVNLDRDIDKLPKYDKIVAEDKMLLNGDIVFVDASEDYEGTCKTFVVYNKNKLPFISGLHTFFGRNKTSLIHIDFQKYLTKIPEIKKQIFKYVQGYKVYGISRENLQKVNINLPSYHEQEKIAEILDCATRQVELQEQLVDKLKVQKKAFMQKLLTPQPDWQEVKLGDICEDIYQPQTVPQKEFKNNGYKVYGANGFIGFYDKYNHKEWQVVLSCRGDCGTINKTEPESWINGNAMVLKMEGNELIDKNYFYYQCLATSFKDVIDNSGIPQITRTPLLKKNFRFIKNMKVQKKIANFFINIDKLIELQQKLLWQYKLRQKALMQLLLTGIVRVN